MIISQTPYRVSFAGGGTDLPSFFRRGEMGAVLSVTIARHLYVTVHSRFEPNIRVAYSRTEVAQGIDQVQHELAREAMRLTGVGPPLEITTIGDVPAGTGMGSSSSLTVGLLNALYGYRGQIVDRYRLAREAVKIEVDILKKPIGLQDQYAAAMGGLNYIEFHPDGRVDVHPVPCRSGTLEELERWTLLLYTSGERSADDILRRQSDGTGDQMPVLRQMRDQAAQMRRAFAEAGDLREIARLLDEGWALKRSLGFGISNERVDGWYAAARKAGAEGGKLLGAGGEGFLLLLAPPERHAAIRAALGNPRELEFRVDRRGSRIVFISEQH
jgi:D-glycero-alpha-D-manno-heptose-7-phosphate kinase